MKKLFLLFVVISILISCVSDLSKIKNNNESIKKDFTILKIDFEIEQDGKDIYPENGIILLKKIPFIIKYQLKEIQSIYFNFSTNKELYSAVTDSKDFTKILGIGGYGAAEVANGNPDKNIFLNNEGWHVWYVYNGEGRFDKITKNNDVYLVERIVDNIFDTIEKQNVDFSKLDIIYLVGADINYDRSKRKYSVNEVGAIKILFK